MNLLVAKLNYFRQSLLIDNVVLRYLLSMCTVLREISSFFGKISSFWPKFYVFGEDVFSGKFFGVVKVPNLMRNFIILIREILFYVL